MSPISTRQHGDVLIVLSNNPPVNALGAAVREGLVAAIAEAEADDAVHAVVIACEGQTFFAGADITEFGKPPHDAVAARGRRPDRGLHQAGRRRDPRHRASAAGSRSRSACHYRVAVPSAKLGMPEVKLGLLPGAGGTQRLPRVAGVAQGARDGGDRQSDRRQGGLEIGLIDRLIEGELIQHAVAYAEEVRDVRPLPKARERAGQAQRARANPDIFDDFRKENARKFRGFEAPRRHRRAVEAAVAKPYAEGVLEERKLFMELMSGTQAKAQQYFFFAERKANKIDGLPEDTEPRDDPPRRRDRRRDDGRRHLDELPRRPASR